MTAVKRKRARGICSVCRRDLSLRQNGTLRKHGSCDGWGYDPLRRTKEHGWLQPHNAGTRLVK